LLARVIKTREREKRICIGYRLKIENSWKKLRKTEKGKYVKYERERKSWKAGYNDRKNGE